jgi:hypothetical protein
MASTTSFLQMPAPPIPATPPLLPGAPLLPALPSLALPSLMPLLPRPPLVPGTPVPPRPPEPPLLPGAGASLERRRDDGAYPGFVPWGLPGMYPGMSPNDVGSRVAFAMQGMAPFGTDCCNCVANEEDYRVHPYSSFLEMQASEPEAAAAEAEVEEGAAPSFLQTAPQFGFTPYGAGTRQMTNTMGLNPAGIDCCPCLGNEEDYRVYPRTPLGGMNPFAGAAPPFM